MLIFPQLLITKKTETKKPNTQNDGKVISMELAVRSWLWHEAHGQTPKVVFLLFLEKKQHGLIV